MVNNDGNYSSREGKELVCNFTSPFNDDDEENEEKGETPEVGEVTGDNHYDDSRD